VPLFLAAQTCTISAELLSKQYCALAMKALSQLAVVPQGRDLNGCGFHALFNASAALAHLGTGPGRGLALLTHSFRASPPLQYSSLAASRGPPCSLCEVEVFEGQREAWVDALRARARQEGDRFYPWTNRCIDAGKLSPYDNHSFPQGLSNSYCMLSCRRAGATTCRVFDCGTPFAAGIGRFVSFVRVSS
jgi:hypothetical protein